MYFFFQWYEKEKREYNQIPEVNIYYQTYSSETENTQNECIFIKHFDWAMNIFAIQKKKKNEIGRDRTQFSCLYFISYILFVDIILPKPMNCSLIRFKFITIDWISNWWFVSHFPRLEKKNQSVKFLFLHFFFAFFHSNSSSHTSVNFEIQ